MLDEACFPFSRLRCAAAKYCSQFFSRFYPYIFPFYVCEDLILSSGSSLRRELQQCDWCVMSTFLTKQTDDALNRVNRIDTLARIANVKPVKIFKVLALVFNLRSDVTVK